MSPFLVRWIKLSLVVVVGCGFLAMAIYAFVMRDEIRNAQIEPPLVTAPEEALKRRPEQPGGMEIPNRDKLVFDLLDSEATVSGAFPVPAPGEAVEVSDTPVEGEAVEETAITPSAVEPLPAAKAPVAVALQPAAQPVVAATRVSASMPVQQPAAVAAAPAKIEVKPVEKVAEKPVAKPVEKAAAGGWSVQVAAVGSKADGDKMTAKLVKQFPALGSLTPRLQATPDGKRFRVQFSGLKDRNAAAALCGKLGTKQACFPVAPK